MNLPSPGWRDWYKNAHELRSRETGAGFEKYVTSVLDVFHDDFLNPTPKGSLGDGGCDGMAEAGDIVYACYGSKPQGDAEPALKAKIEKDFIRAEDQWEDFTKWRFVTNSPAGPQCVLYISKTQAKHGPGSVRPIAVRLWTPDKFWTNVVSTLAPQQLDVLFPGCPGVADLELADLVPLLDVLSNTTADTELAQMIGTVPIDKMNYNTVPPLKRFEVSSGRLMADRIDSWFDDQSDPDLRDHEGARFRAIYQEAKLVDPDPSAIFERIYVALGGENFRLDTKRANAVYAVTCYFFDRCDIFESPPGYGVGDAVAATN